MITTLLSLILAAHAQTNCRILHVINAHAPARLHVAEVQIAAMLRQQNPNCEIQTRRVADPRDVNEVSTPANLIAVQGFPPSTTWAAAERMGERMAPGARLLLLADGPLPHDQAAVRELFARLDVTDASVYGTSGPLAWPSPPLSYFDMSGGQFFWNLLNAPAWAASSLVLFDLNAWPAVIGYSIAAYAGARAVGALYKELRRRGPRLPDARRLLDLEGTSTDIYTFAGTAGLIAGAVTQYGAQSLMTPTSLLLGVAGFWFTQLHDAEARRNARARAEAKTPNANSGIIHEVRGDDLTGASVSVLEPRLYDCGRTLWP